MPTKISRRKKKRATRLRDVRGPQKRGGQLSGKKAKRGGAAAGVGPNGVRNEKMKRKDPNFREGEESEERNRRRRTKKSGERGDSKGYMGKFKRTRKRIWPGEEGKATRIGRCGNQGGGGNLVREGEKNEKGGPLFKQLQDQVNAKVRSWLKVQKKKRKKKKKKLLTATPNQILIGAPSQRDELKKHPQQETNGRHNPL